MQKRREGGQRKRVRKYGNGGGGAPKRVGTWKTKKSRGVSPKRVGRQKNLGGGGVMRRICRGVSPKQVRKCRGGTEKGRKTKNVGGGGGGFHQNRCPNVGGGGAPKKGAKT